MEVLHAQLDRKSSLLCRIRVVTAMAHPRNRGENGEERNCGSFPEVWNVRCSVLDGRAGPQELEALNARGFMASFARRYSLHVGYISYMFLNDSTPRGVCICLYYVYIQ